MIKRGSFLLDLDLEESREIPVTSPPPDVALWPGAAFWDIQLFTKLEDG